MLRIRPLLIFMTLSLGLHWLVFSVMMINPAKKALPQFKNSLDVVTVELLKPALSPTPTGNQENIVPTTQPINDSKDVKETFERQPLFLRGSIWNRRPLDRQGNNFSNAQQSNGLHELNLKLHDLKSENGNQTVIECNLKELDTKLVYECNFPASFYLKKEINEILSAQIIKSFKSMPYCINILFVNEKWHAKACH